VVIAGEGVGDDIVITGYPLTVAAGFRGIQNLGEPT